MIFLLFFVTSCVVHTSFANPSIMLTPTQQHAARSAAASADPAPTAEPLLPDNALPPLGQPSPEKESPEPSSPVVVESEDAKADRLWQEYLRTDDSLMTRLFGGQLQSSVLCHKCSTRFTMYEPFVDLSLPLGREGKGLGWFGSKTPATIADCLTTFTADELLQVRVGGCQPGALSLTTWFVVGFHRHAPPAPPPPHDHNDALLLRNSLLPAITHLNAASTHTNGTT